jgi:hypothetical protein
LSILDCPFSFLCCLSFCLSLSCVLCTQCSQFSGFSILDCPFSFLCCLLFCLSLSCVLKGQSRMENPENWLHWVHKTQDKDKQNKRQHRKLKGQSRMDNPENWLHWVHKTQVCFVCLCPVSCVPNVASSLDFPFLITLSVFYVVFCFVCFCPQKTAQKTRKMSNTEPTKFRWIQVLANGKQFLLLIRKPKWRWRLLRISIHDKSLKLFM